MSNSPSDRDLDLWRYRYERSHWTPRKRPYFPKPIDPARKIREQDENYERLRLMRSRLHY